MSYTDTTLTPATGYTNVNNKQVYDAIATALGSRSPWSFVESVDFVNGTTTSTTYVWKCASSGSGLSADFYVGFMVQFTNNVGTGLGYSTTLGVRVYLFEQYNSTTHTASKMAMALSTTAQTLAADGSNTTSWTLSAAPSTTAPNIPVYSSIGPAAASTSYRLLLTCAIDSIIAVGQQTASIVQQMYVGAIDTLLSPTDDPLPLVVGTGGSSPATNTTLTNQGYFSTTRQPKLGGQTVGNVFCFGANAYHSSLANAQMGLGYQLQSANVSAAGTLGLSGDTNASLYWGVVCSRICLSTTGSGSTASARGGQRGYLKHMLSAMTAPYSFGDTFTIDGVSWAGLFGHASNSNDGYGLLDTSA